MKIKVKLSKTPPQEPGQYLFFGIFGGEPELINVYRQPKRFEYGVEWPEILVCQGRNVEKLKGSFSEKIEFEKE